jgi:hypothetical protein
LSDQRFHQGVSEQRFDQGVSDRRFDQGMSDGLFDQGVSDGRFDQGVSDQRFDQGVSFGRLVHGVSDGLFDQGVGEQRFDQGVSDGRFDQGGSDQLFDQLIWKSGRRPEADLNADWLGEPLFPARSWLRNHARDSALAIASCQPEYPTQAHTSNATPHFGSPAWPYSGAGTPNSEPDSNEPIAVPVRAVSQDGVIFLQCFLLQNYRRDTKKQARFGAVAKPSKPTPSGAVPRGRRTKNEYAALISSISREDLMKLFRMPQEQAAAQVGLYTTSFKELCRERVGSPNPQPPHTQHRTPQSPTANPTSHRPSMDLQGIPSGPYTRLKNLDSQLFEIDLLLKPSSQVHSSNRTACLTLVSFTIPV